MSLYFIGDVQGCDEALGRLLDTVGFSPSRDRLIVLGDLVNRGPASLAALRRIMALGHSAQTLLGNHDLHLLATAHGVRKPHRNDTVGDILDAPWPQVDTAALEQSEIELMVQVNGKLRDTLNAPRGLDRAAAEELALASEKVQRLLDGNPPRKVIVVPDRLVNIVA